MRRLDPDAEAKRAIGDAILRDAVFDRVSPTEVRIHWPSSPNHNVPESVEAFLEEGKWRIDLR